MTRTSRLRKQREAEKAKAKSRKPNRRRRQPTVRPTAPAQLVQKPLPDVSTLDGSVYSWGDDPNDDHALQRLHQRGIGVFEVLAALAEPDITLPASKHHPGRRLFFRGDLGVVLEGDGRTIVTVVDRLNGSRTSPRVALAPPCVPTNSSDNSLPERQPLMPTRSTDKQAEATEQGADKDLHVDLKAVGSAPAALAYWVLACQIGERFTPNDVIQLFQDNLNFTASAIRQQTGRWAKPENGWLDRAGWGNYKVTETSLAYARNLLGLQSSETEQEDSRPEQDTTQAMTVGELDQAAAELDDQPTAEPTVIIEEPAVEPVVKPTVIVIPAMVPPVQQPTEPAESPTPVLTETVLHSAKSTMKLKLTADWGNPPPRLTGQGAITEAVRYHVLDSVLAQLKEHPGQWMRILEITGGANPTDLAGKRVVIFKRDNPYPQLELTARPIQEGKSAGVWARWVDKPAISKAKQKETAKANSAA
jgi:hypothetical protein